MVCILFDIKIKHTLLLNKIITRAFHLLIFLSFKVAWCNHALLSDIQLQSGNQVHVTLSWENCWNLTPTQSPGNHDAVYLFLKGLQNNGQWKTISLQTDTLSYQILAFEKVLFQPAKNKIGALVIPTKTASTFKTRFAMTFNESLDSFSKLMLVGIEMVFIPDGAFYVGDQSSIGRLGTSDSLLPFFIQNESSIAVRKGNKSLDAHYDPSIDFSSNVTPFDDVPTAYPKGTRGFYCMKYEITQEQYAQFLNCLTYPQQVNRANLPKIYTSQYLINPQGIQYGNGITADLTRTPAFFYNDLNTSNIGGSSDDGQTKACNYLSWQDLTAYLDWSGLRPMTELEYEKICRGPLYPVKREYAWGNDSMIDANQLSNLGEETEHCTDSILPGYGFSNRGNYNPGKDLTVLRAGFAATNQSNRLQSGGTFYGVKEMTGNAWEMVINLSKNGLNYTGSFGDGNLDEQGYATNPDWDSQTAGASGVKGGGWNSGVQLPYNDCAVSDRFYIYQNQSVKRNTTGGRGIVQ